MGDPFLISSPRPSYGVVASQPVRVLLLRRSSSGFIWGGWFWVEHVSESNQMLLPFCGHLELGLAPPGSAWIGLARDGSAGSARLGWGSAQLGSARPGSAPWIHGSRAPWI